MAFAVDLFRIGAEFSFETKLASQNVTALEKGVEKLAKTTDRAVKDVGLLGAKYAFSFSGAQGGMVGVLKTAIDSTELFKNSQLALINVLDANKDKLTGPLDNFNDKMGVANNLLKLNNEEARKFAISSNQLFSGTLLLAETLFPQGLGGINAEGARTLARNALKSARLFGVSEEYAPIGISNIISGGAGIQNPIFRALRNSAPEVFKEAGVSDTASFNALNIAKRFDVINKALAKFTKNTELMEKYTRTMGGLIQRIQDLFTGLDSVLRPLASPIYEKIIDFGYYLTDLLNKGLRMAFEDLGKVIESLIEKPKELISNLAVLKNFQKDFGIAKITTSLLILFTHLKFLGPLLIKISGVIGGTFGKSIEKIGVMLGKSGGAFKLLSVGLGIVFVTLAKWTGVLAVVYSALAGVTKGIAMFKTAFIEGFLNKLNKQENFDLFSRLSIAFERLISPFKTIIDIVADLTFTFLSGVTGIDGKTNQAYNKMLAFADALIFITKPIEVFALGLKTIYGGLKLIFQLLSDFIKDSLSFFGIGKGSSFSVGQRFDDFFSFISEDYLRRQNLLDPLGDLKEKPAVIQNFGEVKIALDVGDQQVDRIAFTIKEALAEQASNPRQAQGRQFKQGLIRRASVPF